MTITRRNILAVGLSAMTVTAVPTALLAGSAGGVAMNAGPDGVMLKGHDPVAYFTQGAAVKGTPDIAARHDGVTYHFASAEHREMFRANPDKFAPAYGGFCAMGTVMGIKLDTDPALFRVVDDRLYLNTSEPAQARWLTDVPDHIARANEKWAQIRDTPAAELEPN